MLASVGGICYRKAGRNDAQTSPGPDHQARISSMAAAIDITGKRFGKLVALSRAEGQSRQPYWNCECDCGAVRKVRGAHLRGGKIASCGCGRGHPTHGESSTRLWAVWKAMKQRCRNPNVSSYHRYGGRGISYDPAWETYPAFAEWALSHGYANNLELDRIDNDGNYTASNCQFIPHRENSRKTSAVRAIEFEGRTVPVFELAERFNLEPGTLWTRLRRGWPIERALIPPIINRKKGR
jgi:hypothetical protein